MSKIAIYPNEITGGIHIIIPAPKARKQYFAGYTLSNGEEFLVQPHQAQDDFDRAFEKHLAEYPTYIDFEKKYEYAETEEEFIERIAKKDVPTGLPYLIIDSSDVPEDREFRDAWSADFSFPHGYGD